MHMHKSSYYYISAAAATGIAGILHFVLGVAAIGMAPIFGILLFFLVAGIAQLFWVLPMIKRWGRIWGYGTILE
jgi:hypothetical protein